MEGGKARGWEKWREGRLPWQTASSVTSSRMVDVRWPASPLPAVDGNARYLSIPAYLRTFIEALCLYWDLSPFMSIRNCDWNGICPYLIVLILSCACCEICPWPRAWYWGLSRFVYIRTCACIWPFCPYHLVTLIACAYSWQLEFVVVSDRVIGRKSWSESVAVWHQDKRLTSAFIKRVDATPQPESHLTTL